VYIYIHTCAYTHTYTQAQALNVKIREALQDADNARNTASQWEAKAKRFEQEVANANKK
jgi:hypothetical protein